MNKMGAAIEVVSSLHLVAFRVTLNPLPTGERGKRTKLTTTLFPLFSWKSNERKNAQPATIFFIVKNTRIHAFMGWLPVL